MKIYQLLKMTKDEYELLILDWWTTYCFHKTANRHQAQKLLINKTLFNWWRAQLAAIETEFEEDAKPYDAISTQVDVKKLYAKHAYKLQLYYNSNLIKTALKYE